MIAANAGSIPGKVAFAVRTVGSRDIPDFLSGYGIEDEVIEYYQTSSVAGLLGASQFRQVLERLGFAGTIKASA